MIRSIEPAELQRRLAAGEALQLVDVREPEELEIARLMHDVHHLPLGEIAARAHELDPDVATVCICHHGVRSAGAAGYLRQLGFAEVYNLTGGVDRWAVDVDPRMRRY